MTGDPTSEPAPATLPHDAGEGRSAYVISQLYYYVAAVVGVAFVIGGAIALLLGFRSVIFPDEFEEARDGIQQMLVGLSFVLPGVAAMWWHLRQARRREGRMAPGAFWGSALYFHLVALIALIIVLAASTGLLLAMSGMAYPDCRPAPPVPVERGVVADVETPPPHEVCHPPPEESARTALDAAIFLVVAGPVMWWHLGQGRRLTTPPSGG